MAQMVRVYNRGKRPIVWHRSRKLGRLVIHPGRFDVFAEDKAKEIISKFKDACSEEDFKSKKKKEAPVKKGEK